MRVGIMGHQRLADPSAWTWVRSELATILRNSTSPLVGVSSLAIGVDQIFAELVLRQGGQLEVIIPFPDYAQKFTEDHDAQEYERLLRSASGVETLRRSGSDEETYMKAGMRVVNSSDLLVAVWDGQPSRGLGGTADVVGYAVRQKKRVVHLNPVTRAIESV